MKFDALPGTMALLDDPIESEGTLMNHRIDIIRVLAHFRKVGSYPRSAGSSRGMGLQWLDLPPRVTNFATTRTTTAPSLLALLAPDHLPEHREPLPVSDLKMAKGTDQR